MKIEIEVKQSIPDMLRKLDAQRITSNDIETLNVIRNFLTELREPLSANALTYLFPPDIRTALASAVSDAVVGIINTKLTGKTDGRRLAPEVAAEREAKKRALLVVHGFKGRISSLSDSLATFCLLAKREQPSDVEYRQERFPKLMTPVIGAVMDLRSAAKDEFDTDMKEMVEQTLPRFEALVTRWMHIETLSEEFNPAKSEFFLNWQATLRSLTRDATDRIRALKA